MRLSPSSDREPFSGKEVKEGGGSEREEMENGEGAAANELPLEKYPGYETDKNCILIVAKSLFPL